MELLSNKLDDIPGQVKYPTINYGLDIVSQPNSDNSMDGDKERALLLIARFFPNKTQVDPDGAMVFRFPEGLYLTLVSDGLYYNSELAPSDIQDN